MYYRLNADDYYWEIVDDKGEAVAKTTTETEAKTITERSV